MLYCTDTCCRPEAEATAKLLAERTVTARTAHSCLGCPEPIKPGQRYVRRAWLADGAVVTEKLHGWCE